MYIAISYSQVHGLVHTPAFKVCMRFFWEEQMTSAGAHATYDDDETFNTQGPSKQHGLAYVDPIQGSLESFVVFMRMR